MNAVKKLFPKLGTGIGYGLFAGGGCLFQLVQFVVVAVAGLGMIWWAITLFMEGSILLGIVVLLIGTPLAIGIAGWLAPFIFIMGIITAIIWGAIKLFGSDVSFGSVWDTIFLVITILFLALLALGVLSSLFKAIFKGEMNWFRRHLNWSYVLAYLLWFVLNLYGYESDIASWLSLVVAILWLVISGWVIKQKGRSLWWILLSWIGSPLWLKNIEGVRELAVHPSSHMNEAEFEQMRGENEEEDKEDLFANISTEDLLKLKYKHKSNKSLVKMIDDALEARVKKI